ncbi:hypothetical protein PSTT_04212, partial [Puccinia striiformis]
LPTLAYLISLRRVRLGLLVATWPLCRQSYIDLSFVTIGRKTCYLTKEILRPTGLEPMEDFCMVSLIWSSRIIGLATTGYLFRCIWIYLKEELRLFWVELQEWNLCVSRFILAYWRICVVA